MRLFDSNVLIYSSRPEFAHLRPLIIAPDAYVSAISIVEVLGFPDLTEDDRNFHENQLAVADIVSIDDAVLNRTVALRRIKRRMPIADALIAATALEFNLTLVTSNRKDFDGIPDLRVESPPVVLSSGGDDSPF